MAKDQFPETHYSTIHRKLDGGESGLKDVILHVMDLYRGPLSTYYRGCSLRWLGEPDEIVNDFFISRLLSKGFFDKWRSSGLPLRRWLINALWFYMRENLKANKKHKWVALDSDIPAECDPPSHAVDREFARAIVLKAKEQASQICETDGFGQHWKVFIGHTEEGRSYRQMANELNLAEDQARMMVRPAKKRFRSALRELLIYDGVLHDAVDREIERLLELLRE